MEELASIVKTYGPWTAVALVIAYLLFTGGMKLIPVWVDKVKNEGDAVQKRINLEMELMTKKHAAESDMITITAEAVKTAIPNAIRDLELAMSTGHQQVIAGHSNILTAQTRLEQKIDTSYDRIEKKIERIPGVRGASDPDIRPS